MRKWKIVLDFHLWHCTHVYSLQISLTFSAVLHPLLSLIRRQPANCWCTCRQDFLLFLTWLKPPSDHVSSLLRMSRTHQILPSSQGQCTPWLLCLSPQQVDILHSAMKPVLRVIQWFLGSKVWPPSPLPECFLSSACCYDAHVSRSSQRLVFFFFSLKSLNPTLRFTPLSSGLQRSLRPCLVLPWESTKKRWGDPRPSTHQLCNPD